MFLGEYYLQFSGHGRVVLPHRFRDVLLGENELVLSRGLDGCIWGFNKADWDKEAVKQLEEPITEKRARDLRRYLFSAAQSVELDGQGRFIIPKALLEYSGLRQKVVIIGAGDHFEVWSPKRWQKVIKNLVLETFHETSESTKGKWKTREENR